MIQAEVKVAWKYQRGGIKNDTYPPPNFSYKRGPDLYWILNSLNLAFTLHIRENQSGIFKKSLTVLSVKLYKDSKYPRYEEEKTAHNMQLESWAWIWTLFSMAPHI